MADKTKLTRNQYINIANKWIKDNPKKWNKLRANNDDPYSKLQQILEQEHGKPYWRDRPGRSKITGSMPTKDDPGIGFRMYPVGTDKDGNQKVHFKSDATRAATRGNPTKGSSGTRLYLERAATPPGVDFADSQRAMAEARAAGVDMDGGHIIPLDRQVAGQEFKVQSGRGTVQEYHSNYAASGQAVGHQRDNIQPQHKVANRILQRADYAALDKHLGILDQISSLIAWSKGENAMSNFLSASMDVAADAAGPVGQITQAAFTNLVDEPVRQATGEGVFDAIPNGSQEERRAENKKINKNLRKNSSGKGNGAAHSISNEIEYMANKIANGQLPYNGD